MHDEWTDRLSSYRDHELSPDERAQVDAHLAECATCRGVLAEIELIVLRAGALPELAPRHDLWPALATRIAAEPSPRAGDEASPVAPRARRHAARFSFTATQLAAAAIALVLLSATTVWLLLGRESTAPRFASPAADANGVMHLAANDVAATYDPTIEDLERTLAEARDLLDAETIAVLEQSLATIDRAIQEARAALADDPANEFLSRHLDTTMRRKVDLLRQATRLAART
jgi:hypothetical protein